MRRFLLVLFFVLVGLAAGCKRSPPRDEWPSGMTAVSAGDGIARVQSAKGDVVLFVLYASWCSGCRAELPGIDHVVSELAPRGLRVVALALDEDPKDYDEMLSDEKPRFDLVRIEPLDHAAIAKGVHAFGGKYAGSIPYTALFSRDGTLVHEWTDGAREADLRARITPLL